MLRASMSATMPLHVDTRDRRGPDGPRVARALRSRPDADRRLLGLRLPARRPASGRMGAGELGEPCVAAAQLPGSGASASRGSSPPPPAARATCRAGVRGARPSASSPRHRRRRSIPRRAALVAAHRRRGHTLAVVSSATRYQIEPLARELGIPHVLCTQLEVEDGCFTGRHVSADVLRRGQGDRRAPARRASTTSISRESYFYTDSHEDLPLLEIVGRPRPTNPTRRLRAIAARRGWPIAALHATAALPGALEVVRTALALGSIVPSLAARRCPRPPQRQLARRGEPRDRDLGRARHGARRHRRRRHRRGAPVVAPARRSSSSTTRAPSTCCSSASSCGATSSASPRRRCGAIRSSARAFALAGTVFIDRFDRETRDRGARAGGRRAAPRALARRSRPRARAARRRGSARSRRAPSTSRMRGRRSRSCRSSSATPSTRCRSTRSSCAPATVEVAVLPPVDTTSWRVASLEDHMREVREMFLRTLD